MKCRDCINFRQSNKMEAGREISPEVRTTRGICSVNNSRCRPEDECRSGGFSQK